MSTVKTCTSCGKNFEPYHPNRQIRCTDCAAVRNKKRSHTFEEKACEQCGGMFQPKTLRVRHCSQRCQQRARYIASLPDLSRLGKMGPLKGRIQTDEHKRKRAEAVALTLSKQRRHCIHCGEEFTPTISSQKYCSGRCWNAVARKKKAKLHRISVSPSTYEALSALQGGLCAICKTPSGSNGRGDRLAVDHCHDSKQIRGLLCHKCNTALGLFKDDLERLQAAMSYLATARARS